MFLKRHIGIFVGVLTTLYVVVVGCWFLVVCLLFIGYLQVVGCFLSLNFITPGPFQNPPEMSRPHVHFACSSSTPRPHQSRVGTHQSKSGDAKHGPRDQHHL